MAFRAGAFVFMLYIFGVGEVGEFAGRLKRRFGNDGNRFLVEVSGGLTEENIGGFAGGDVDVISTSSIHQGVKHVDFSLKIVH